MFKESRDYNDISSGNISSSATKQKILKKQKAKDIFKKQQSKNIFDKDIDESMDFTFQSMGFTFPDSDDNTNFTFETAYENKDTEEEEKYVFIEFTHLGNNKGV